MKMKPGAAKLKNNQKFFIHYISSLPKSYTSFVSEADWNCQYLEAVVELASTWHALAAS